MTKDNNDGLESNTNTTSISFEKIGCIIRKKKRHRFVVLAIRNERVEGDIATPISVCRDDPRLEWCFLGAWVRITAERKPRDDEGGEVHLEATNVELVQCAPDPGAVILCFQRLLEGSMDIAAFSPTSLQNIQQAKELLEMQPRDKQRKEIAKIVRELQGLDPERLPYQRRPHTRKRFLRVLDQVEERINLAEVVCDNISEETKEEDETTNQQKIISDNEFSNLPLNVPGESIASSRGSLTREEYLQRKKWPQIRWLLQRLHKLGNFRTVLDVGGGRGDLATAIAKEFPAAHVTVVDLNEPSLVAGREYAQQVGLGDRMSFECADFAAYVRDYEENVSANHHKGFDVVVALHACGDLSDLALQFAHQIQAAFVICPCCYTKRYIDQYEPRWIQHYTNSIYCEPAESIADEEHENNNETTQSSSTQKKPFNQGPPGIAKVPFNPSPEEQIEIVQKLAELPEQPTVSHRAMRVINSMRLNAWKEACSAVDIDVQMEQYPSKYSAKNLVLVGEKR